MPRVIDPVGTRFGRLTLLHSVLEKNRPTLGIYRCDCGKEIRVKAISVRTGHTSSCGCFRKDQARIGTVNALTKHGMSRTKVWNTWTRIRQRCTNPNDQRWSQYGGAGIKVCERWMDFENFLADMGLPPSEKHSIDRIDTKGDYTPENCRWADWETQGNNKNNNRYLTIGGEKKTLAQWCRQTGVNYGTAWSRITRNNWLPERAVGVCR